MTACLKLLVGISLSVAAGGVLAHHSTRVFYDYDDDIVVEGTVTWVFWKNPHIRFNLVRVDDAGREELWELEAGSFNTLERVGIGEDVLKVGDVVRVAGPPSRHGLNTIYVSNVLFEDGREVSLQRNQRLRWTAENGTPVSGITENVEAEALAEVEGIFRVWSRSYQDNSSTLPFTVGALEAREAWDPLNEDPGLQCIPPGMPVMMDNPYPIAFTRQGDDIVLRLEEWDGVRVIHLGGGSAPAQPASTPMGSSMGRWEGETLVVTTTNINYPYFDSSGAPQSERVGIVERFTLSDEENRLNYHMTVTDPETFTTPAELTLHYVWEPGEKIKRYECTLAN